MVGSSLFGIFVAVFVFTANQVYTYPDPDSALASNERKQGLQRTRTKRVLTREEEDLANAARAQIVQVLEANLIKFFTLVAAEDGRGQYARQEEDDDDNATLNPNTLPQVAQILGAIFAGNLNLTSIVDKTFGLVPDALRNQVDGLFKILTGQSAATTTTTTPKPAKKPAKRNSTRTTKKPTTTPEDISDIFEEESPASSQRTETEKEAEAKVSTPSSALDSEEEAEAKTTRKVNSRPEYTTIRTKYNLNRNKNKTRTPIVTVPDSEFTDEDENLYRLEQEVISAAVDSEPYVSDKEPRYFIGSVTDILNNFDNGKYNLTKIIKYLPDLFQGANQAFALLEQFGELDIDDFQ